MANGGWTLISRFSNKDSINWMLTSGQWWYDKTSCTGACDSTSTNADMINEGFFLTKGNEIKLTRSDDSIHKALLITTSSCLGGSTFRGKLTSYGNFR